MFDPSYIRGKSHFEDDGSQNYLVFQPVYKYLRLTISDHRHLQIAIFQHGNLKDCLIKVLNLLLLLSLVPGLNHINSKLSVNYDGSCLKQQKVIYKGG